MTPLCWLYQLDQRAEACQGHPRPRRVGPLGPPRGVTSGPDSSGTWGDRTQETHKAINSFLPSELIGRNTHQGNGLWRYSASVFNNSKSVKVGDKWRLFYLTCCLGAVHFVFVSFAYKQDCKAFFKISCTCLGNLNCFWQYWHTFKPVKLPEPNTAEKNGKSDVRTFFSSDERLRQHKSDDKTWYHASWLMPYSFHTHKEIHTAGCLHKNITLCCCREKPSLFV